MSTDTHTTSAGVDVKIFGGDGCRWHPSPALVASYVAGQLACAEAVALTVHLAMCPACAAVHRDVVGVAADGLVEEPPAPDVPEFSRCLVRAKIAARCADRAARLDLPATVAPILKKYVTCSARWWPVFPGVRRLALRIRSPYKSNYDTSLIKIKAGARFPQHAHDDVEYMVVLQGTLVDEHGTYPQGSFLTTRQGECHTPRATGDADVLCLSVARGTVRFTSPWLKWLNPLLRRDCPASRAPGHA